MAGASGAAGVTESSRHREDALATAQRAAAARAADILDGMALVFSYAIEPDRWNGPPPLRAAAGFSSPDEARRAAEALGDVLRQVGEAGQEILLPALPELGERGAGGIVAIPLGAEGRIRGALLAAAPEPPSAANRQAISSLAESVGLRLDHACLSERLRAIEESLQNRTHTEDEKNDEILKLSEALFAQDIELLRSSEKLGTVDKLKSDFIEKMSRELRTPLNSIIEAIISVLAGENEHLSPGAKQSLRSALDEGTAFLRTLQNILDLWRIKQGELPVEAQEVNFREVVEEAIFSVQDTLGEKPVRIEKSFREPFPKIRTDLAKVNQVLFLLLDNAAKFTQEGRIEIRAGIDEGRLCCAIQDSGIGICADDRQYIFDEFFQVDDTATAVYRGAGLGLTLVRDLLALLDGEISLTSEVGMGTEVIFSVPVQVIG